MYEARHGDNCLRCFLVWGFITRAIFWGLQEQVDSVVTGAVGALTLVSANALILRVGRTS